MCFEKLNSFALFLYDTVTEVAVSFCSYYLVSTLCRLLLYLCIEMDCVFDMNICVIRVDGEVSHSTSLSFSECHTKIQWAT